MRNQLEPLFPGIQEQYQTIKSQLETLKNQRQEIESADQEELRSVREEISIVGEGLEMRRREIKTVDGTKVKKSFGKEIDVSFNMNQLSQGNSATIELPSNIEPIQQFMFS